LTDLRLAPDTGAYTVVIAIHVCKQTDTCAVRTLSATVIDTNDDVALAEITEANVQVQNYQTLMALLASDSSKRFVTKPLVSTRNVFFCSLKVFDVLIFVEGCDNPKIISCFLRVTSSAFSVLHLITNKGFTCILFVFLDRL